MAASTKCKFDAAVNVIKSLPKNGSFQPSQEMMLEFYAFYKQATEGPCSLPRPSFWEVVKKAKWDAWNKLGGMSSDEAMLCYVEELKKIIETMPQTQNVAEFMETLGTFYELVEERPLYNSQGRSLSDADIHAKCNGVVDKVTDISRDLSAQMAATEEELMRLGNEGDEAGDGDEAGVAAGDRWVVAAGDRSEDAGDRLDVASSRLSDGESDRTEDINPDSRTSNRGVVEPEDTEEDNPAACSGPLRDNNGDVISVRGERQDRDSPVSPPRPSDLSESEGEEFCDSTDQIASSIGQENVSSTPKRVQLYETLMKVDSGRAETSPVRRDYLPYSPVIPRLSDLRRLPLSDSLRVNSPGEESLNTSVGVSVSRVYPEDVLPRRDESRLGPEDEASALSRTGSLDQSRSRRGLFRPVGVAGGSGPDHRQLSVTPTVNEQIATTLLRLQQDMNSVKSRLDSLEKGKHKKESLWWPLRAVDRTSVFWVVVWPVLIHVLLTAISRRRHRFRR